MIPDNRNANLFKLAIAFNDFGIHQEESERVLLKYQQEDFPEREILRTIKSAYRNTQNFGTKFFEDSETQKKIEKLIRNGKKEKDIATAFPAIDKKEVKKSIEAIKDNLAITDFWEYDQNGRIRLSPHKYKFWLQQHNFFQILSDQFMYLHLHP